jgi:hypothetical protein
VAAYSAGALAQSVGSLAPGLVGVGEDHQRLHASRPDPARQRAQAAALRVSVLTPQEEGADWCDVWAARDQSTTARTFDQLHDLEPANREGAGHDIGK